MRAAVLACASAMVTSVVVLAGSQPRGSEPTLAEVLGRTAAYVAEYQLRLARIVAEETYVQDWYSVGPRGRSFGRRERRSDLALAGADSRAEFRDVFEGDGQVVRPRDGHLEQMLRGPAIAVSLRVLAAGNQARFRFQRSAGSAGAGPPPDASSAQPPDTIFRVSAEVWAIAYDEVRSGTLIRTARRRDQPARGRFWIEPATGRVLASELVLDDRTVRATIEVSFQSEPLLGMLMPVTMRERCESKKTGAIVEGQATYSRFRRLEP